jgi:L-threonylcarbamoyladenylate synthase
MKIVKITKDNLKLAIESAVNVLKNGGTVIFPTETCYGIGVDPTNEEAVDRLFMYKNRPEGKAISIAVLNKEMAIKYVDISPLAENIYKEFLPGPVTVISKSKHKVSKRIESEKGTLGIRIPDHTIPLSIIREFQNPITSTSANISGGKNPYKIEDILDGLSDKKKSFIDLILDFGELPKNPPSTVVDTTLMDINIIREGNIRLSQDMREHVVNNEDETFEIAAKFIESKVNELREKCIILLLNGPMGAGKTQFIKGIGKYLGIKENIKSPTYTIISEYDYKRNKIEGILYHIDVWRLENEDQLKDLEIDKLVKPGNIIAIEWSDKFSKKFFSLNKKATLIKINIQITSSDTRKFSLLLFGSKK